VVGPAPTLLHRASCARSFSSLESNAQPATAIDAVPGAEFAFADVTPGHYHFQLEAMHGAPDRWFDESMGSWTTDGFEIGTGDLDVGTLTIVYQPEY
jgi:hypothetical protein